MIGWLIGRLHVSTTDREVIRFVRSKIRAEIRRDPAKREVRKQIYRDALDAHHRNQKLYRSVMRGGV